MFNKINLNVAIRFSFMKYLIKSWTMLLQITDFDLLKKLIHEGALTDV